MNNKKIIISWALYDLANTIFAVNIVTVYFPLWVTIQNSASDKYYIVPFYCSIVLAALALPFFGIISDQYGAHHRFLVIFTLISVICVAIMGLVKHLIIGVVLFAISNFFDQIAGSVFYPALLPKICPPEMIPFVSGLGVAFGYIGTIVAVLSMLVFTTNSHYQNIFIPTAALFFLFAIPSFIFVKVNVNPHKQSILKNQKVFSKTMKQFIATINLLRQNRPALRFFIAIMLAMNSINCILLNMAVYGKKVLGFQDVALPFFVGFCAVFAFLSALFFGVVTKLKQSKTVLSFILTGWVVFLIMVSLANRKQIFWLIGPVIGILLAGTWTISRAFFIQLAPEERIGELFGLTALAGLCGNIFGPLMWLSIIKIFESYGMIKYRIAVFFLAILIAVAVWMLRKVPENKII